MNKLQDLRAWLTHRVPALARNPDQLLTFIEEGRIRFHAGGNLSHQYSMPVQVVVTDWRDSADTIILPVLEWLSVREPGFDPENTLSFDAEIIDKHTIDLSLRIQVTERVIVTTNNGSQAIEHVLPGELPA